MQSGSSTGARQQGRSGSQQGSSGMSQQGSSGQRQSGTAAKQNVSGGTAAPGTPTQGTSRTSVRERSGGARMAVHSGSRTTVGVRRHVYSEPSTTVIRKKKRYAIYHEPASRSVIVHKRRAGVPAGGTSTRTTARSGTSTTVGRSSSSRESVGAGTGGSPRSIRPKQYRRKLTQRNLWSNAPCAQRRRLLRQQQRKRIDGRTPVTRCVDHDETRGDRLAARQTPSSRLVVRGLDPRIHLLRKKVLRTPTRACPELRIITRRKSGKPTGGVKPGNDGGWVSVTDARVTPAKSRAPRSPPGPLRGCCGAASGRAPRGSGSPAGRRRGDGRAR